MTSPIADCLRDVRCAADVASIDAILKTFLTERGVEEYLFYDPAAPLARGSLTQSFDENLASRFDSQELWRFDPMRLEGRNRPLVWRSDAAPPVSEQADELVWSPMARAGFRQAVMVPIYGPAGRCEVFTVLTRERRWRSRQIESFVNEMVLLTYDVAGFFRSAARSAAPTLTARERDCLEWTARGKTAWEIAHILAISERTAHFHLQNAMRKLGAHSKHQAALSALRLGIISPVVAGEYASRQDHLPLARPIRPSPAPPTTDRIRAGRG